jgi:hypothetical protein
MRVVRRFRASPALAVASAGPSGPGAPAAGNDAHDVFVITTDTSSAAGQDHAFYVSVIGYTGLRR